MDEKMIQLLPFIIIGVCIIIYAFLVILKITKKATNQKIDGVKQWLLIAVTEAEKQFGEGTGALKLSYVYSLFVDKFPSLTTIISFAVFSSLVDEALVRFKNMLSTNAHVSEYVKSEGTTDGKNQQK